MNDRISNYTARFDKVLAYIEAHLDEPLTAERLSRVAHFSRFHFDRQFADFLGTSATRYLLLLRLRRAATPSASPPASSGGSPTGKAGASATGSGYPKGMSPCRLKL